MAEIKSNDLYLDSDGTLGISADVDISKVRRILLTQEGTHYGSMYYLDDSDHIVEVGKKVDSDLISRQAAIDAIGKKSDEIYKTKQKGATYPHDDFFQGMAYAESVVKELPSAQPEPISEAYAKAVRTWLVQYQIKCAELQGRYTPYEVLGWIVNDWRKDNGINQ